MRTELIAAARTGKKIWFRPRGNEDAIHAWYPVIDVVPTDDGQVNLGLMLCGALEYFGYRDGDDIRIGEAEEVAA